ncbi:hypothetical protein [Methylogaea oryzae]|nr:hypothetical protein [Methylogaea oryzae]
MIGLPLNEILFQAPGDMPSGERAAYARIHRAKLDIIAYIQA